MITTDNITSHEFIGLNTEIIHSANPQVIGLNGKIIDETKSMFIINTAKGVKSIAKSTSNWKFSIAKEGEEEDVIVKGSKISKRPWDRLS